MSTELATPPGAMSAEALIQIAITKKVDVGTMERLLAMRAQIKAEAAEESFTLALAAFQKACPVISKTKSVLNKGGQGVRYSYAPLDSIIVQVRDLLHEHGFNYSFDSSTERNTVTAICTASHKDGHSRKSSFVAHIDPDAYMNVAQRYGSAMTFAKRYAFCNAFGIVTGDADDDSQSTVPDNSARAKLERLKAQRAKITHEAQDAEIVNRAPEEGDEPAKPIVTHIAETLDSVLSDFLLGVSEASDATELTPMIEQANGFDTAAKQKAAKRAIVNRAKVLGLKWDAGSSSYIGGKAA